MSPHRRNRGLSPLKPPRSPASRTLLRCYAREGRNWHCDPERNAPLRLVLIEPSTRAWRWEPGLKTTRGLWCCEAVQAPWRVLDWLPADGSLPHGEPDEVDPAVARFDFCMSPVAPSPAHDTPIVHCLAPKSYYGPGDAERWMVLPRIWTPSGRKIPTRKPVRS